jgi:hypothetical protein
MMKIFPENVTENKDRKKEELQIDALKMFIERALFA